MAELIKRAEKAIGEITGEILVVIAGWSSCMISLVGAYSLGWWLAPHVGWNAGRETLGLLSVLAAIWLYEHRNLENKYLRLREIIDRQER
jgi:uncharacterized membrane protein